MSVAVDVEALVQRLADYGPAGFLITVGDDGAPHVVSVHVELDDDRLRTRLGRRSCANVAARPAVTLLFPAGTGEAYSLLIDGVVEGAVDPDGGLVGVRPTGAVLHRVADAAGTGPTCLPVEST